MFQNQGQGKQEERLPNLPDRPYFIGCSPWGILIWVVLVIGIIFLLWNSFKGGLGTPAQINYSAFRRRLSAGNIERVTVLGEEIRGELKEPAESTLEDGEAITYTNFVTFMPSFGDEELLSRLENQEVEVETRPKSDFSGWAILLYLLPFLFLIGVGYLLMRRVQTQGQGIFSMGRSRAKLYDRKQEGTTFDDVAGAAGAKTELREIIEFLKDPERFQRLGGEIPKGVLLVGPPGTGKTLLARAVAGEAGVPFFSITGSDFMEMFVGVGASRVRDMFEEAKKSASCLPITRRATQSLPLCCPTLTRSTR